MKRFLTLATLLLTLTLSSQAFAAKSLDDSVLDAALNHVKNNATTAVFCSGVPANYAGVAAVALVTKTGLTSASYTGPADDTSGRKLTLNAFTGMTPSANGTVRALCLTNGTSTLYGCTYSGGSTDGTTGGQAVTTGQTWDYSGTTKLNFLDPN